MRFIFVLVLTWPIFALGSENELPEFDLARFQASSFSCTSDSECNSGICFKQKCFCDLGYRDTVAKSCAHKMAELDKKTPFILETTFGLVFPVGLSYLNIWGAVLARLFVEATAIGLSYGGFVEPRGSFERSAYWMGASIFGVVHTGAWIATVYGLKQFWRPDPAFLKSWHKDKGMADLVIPANKLVDSARIIRKSFSDTDCAIIEKCVDGPGERRLLIFDTYLYNQGDADFVVGLEEIKPEWSTCHQHYHGPDSTTYFIEHQLNLANGTVFKTLRYGHKQGYCFIDSARFNGSYEGKFDCGLPQLTRQYTQGITAGHADLYNSKLDCQWIDITGLPPGDYELKITVNPNGSYYQDRDLTNNESIIKVRIPTIDPKERNKNGLKIESWVVQGPEV